MNFKELAEQIAKQDNLATQYPIFEVRDKEIVITDSDFSFDGSKFVHDDIVLDSKEELEQWLADNGEDYNVEEEDFEERFYVKVDKTITFFFTREAAQQYINANRHHFDEPFIYVESAYRNYQIIELVKEIFKQAEMELPSFWS